MQAAHRCAEVKGRLVSSELFRRTGQEQTVSSSYATVEGPAAAQPIAAHTVLEQLVHWAWRLDTLDACHLPRGRERWRLTLVGRYASRCCAECIVRWLAWTLKIKILK